MLSVLRRFTAPQRHVYQNFFLALFLSASTLCAQASEVLSLEPKALPHTGKALM